MLDSVCYVHQHDMDLQHRTYSYRRWEGSVLITINDNQVVVFILNIKANNYSRSNTLTGIKSKTFNSFSV